MNDSTANQRRCAPNTFEPWFAYRSSFCKMSARAVAAPLQSERRETPPGALARWARMEAVCASASSLCAVVLLALMIGCGTSGNQAKQRLAELEAQKEADAKVLAQQQLKLDQLEADKRQREAESIAAENLRIENQKQEAARAAELERERLAAQSKASEPPESEPVETESARKERIAKAKQLLTAKEKRQFDTILEKIEGRSNFKLKQDDLLFALVGAGSHFLRDELLANPEPHLWEQGRFLMTELGCSAAEAIGFQARYDLPDLRQLCSVVTFMKQGTRLNDKYLRLVRSEPLLIKYFDAHPASAAPPPADPVEAKAATEAATIKLLIDTIEKNGDSRQREAAMLRLAQMGTAASPAVPALTKVLTEDSRQVRISAMAALAAIGPDSKPALGELEKLAEAESDVSGLATIAVASIDPESSGLSKTITRLLVAGTGTLPRRVNTPLARNNRVWACQALIIVGERAEWAPQILKGLLAMSASDLGENAEVFKAAAQALAAVGGKDKGSLAVLKNYKDGKGLKDGKRPPPKEELGGPGGPGGLGGSNDPIAAAKKVADDSLRAIEAGTVPKEWRVSLLELVFGKSAVTYPPGAPGSLSAPGSLGAPGPPPGLGVPGAPGVPVK